MSPNICVIIDCEGNGLTTDTCIHRTVRSKKSEASKEEEFTPLGIFEALNSIVKEEKLSKRVEVKKGSCLWGCSFGPRIDVIIKTVQGQVTVLYGRKYFHGEISMRGKVEILAIPSLKSLRSIIVDNLRNE